MKTKLKLKPQIKIGIVVVIVFIMLSIYGFNAYEEYVYEQSYEYKLMYLGYSKEEYLLLNENFSQEYLEKFVNMGYNENILLLLEEKYYISSNFEEYLAYMEEENLSVSEVITIINLGLDESFYENTTIVDSNYESLMLVNKYNYLTEDYVPDNLVSVSTSYSWGSYGDVQVVDFVYDAFLSMAYAALEEGINLMINSAYRRYESQEEVYNTYDSAYGSAYADTIAARAGYSEHQTGYALDIFSLETSSQTDFADSASYEWLVANCYKYGFILRYPLDKEEITGFAFESWHYRYVGIEAASFITSNDLTFDEYYTYYVD